MSQKCCSTIRVIKAPNDVVAQRASDEPTNNPDEGEMSRKAKICAWIIAIPAMIAWFCMMMNIALLAPTMVVVTGAFGQAWLLVAGKIPVIEGMTNCIAFIAFGVFMWSPALFGEKLLDYLGCEEDDFESLVFKAFIIEVIALAFLGAVAMNIASRF